MLVILVVLHCSLQGISDDFNPVASFCIDVVNGIGEHSMATVKNVNSAVDP